MRELPTIDEPVPVLELTAAEIAELSAEVRALAAERDAMILAHNYQVPEVQEVADFVGDSLGLARRAAATDAEVIAFCGVHFMAETASVLCPTRTVLIPDPQAGCSLADSITAAELRNWKSRHPGAVTVMYVNTSAEVKAETDYCCTSSNAVQVVEHVLHEHGPETEVLFGPDMWLGSNVERALGMGPERQRGLELWPGECHVHAGIRVEDVDRARDRQPGSELFIHPECGCVPDVVADEAEPPAVKVLSTGQMLDEVRGHPDGRYVVATETGMLHPLRQAAPGALLSPATERAVCKYMKMITLPGLRDSLRTLKHVVEVPDSIAKRARLPIERMVAIG